MKKILSLFAICSIIIISSCTKVDEEDQKNVGTLTLPIASFYFSGNEGPAPVSVAFHNTSQYSDQWQWTFHNGSTSNEFEPSFTYYNNTGEDKTFLVKLTATDTYTGEINTRSKSILIHSSN